MSSAAALSADMASFLLSNGIPGELAYEFTAEELLRSAVVAGQERGLIPVPDTTISATTESVSAAEQTSALSSSPAPDENESAGEATPPTSPAPSRASPAPSAVSSSAEEGSEVGSPEPEGRRRYPLVEASPLAGLRANKRSVSRHPTDVWRAFFMNEPTSKWNLLFFASRLASILTSLVRITRVGDALVIGQFAIDLLGREPLFSAIEYYLSFPWEGSFSETAKAVRLNLFDLYEELRKRYTREQSRRLRDTCGKAGLAWGAEAEKSRAKGRVVRGG